MRGVANSLSLILFIRLFRISKIRIAPAIVALVTMIPVSERKTKSKKEWKNGIKKAPIIMPMIEERSAVRRRLSGKDSQ